MRHLVKGKKLGRNTSHRKATMKALACSLIEHKSIQTTVTKAKELRRYIEPVITKAKEDSSHTRRQAFSSLQDKNAVTILFNDIMPEVGDRPGGYTRVLKLGFRLGDSAEMALIELVDFSDYQPENKSSKKKRTRRAGKSNTPTSSDEDLKDTAEKEEKVVAPAESKSEINEEVTNKSEAKEEETNEVEASKEAGDETDAASDANTKKEEKNESEEADDDTEDKENKK
jgi:large subunit ribosomal protein L17